jgi:hypothetical protein
MKKIQSLIFSKLNIVGQNQIKKIIKKLNWDHSR